MCSRRTLRQHARTGDPPDRLEPHTGAGRQSRIGGWASRACLLIAELEQDGCQEQLAHGAHGCAAPRHPGPPGAALGAALLAGGGGAAYAVLHQPASTVLGLACSAGTSQQEFQQAGGNLSSYVGASSGDPVADCAAEYDRLEVAAPLLRGYTTGESYLSVVPEAWPVPSDWQPLAVDFRTVPARLELSQRLGDVLDGPQSRCRSAEAVEAIVRRDLADLAMTGWTIKRLEQAERADGQDWCALAF